MLWSAAAFIGVVGCQTTDEVTQAESSQQAPVVREAVEPVKEVPKVVEKKVAEAPKVESPKPKEEPPVPEVAPKEITSVDLERLFLLKEEGKVLLVDVRPSVFFVLGHIDGAISMPLKSFEASYPKKKGELDAAVAVGKVIVLYCADLNCPDAYATAKKLVVDGYATSIYKGGWDEWKKAGL